REAEIWAPLNHKNVVPFLGMAHGIGGPILVSPLYELGHIGMFLAKRPEVVNRAGILLGVAAGLEYLHAHKIVHGDLKLQNVLVDESGTPFICDFGISKIINQHGFTTVGVGTLPYMAPELLIPFDLGILKQQPSTTTATDVYSFGILALEILTSEPPKRGSVRFFMSAKDIGPDLSPKRVDYGHSVITDEIWSVLEPCWAFEPQSRPAISEVRVQLMLTFA
ncbi:kinase-like domain-containing protein, partial [Mycena metata]